MKRRKMFLGLAGLCVLGAVLLGSVISAQGQEKKRGGKGRVTAGRRISPEEREQRNADRMKGRLGATDAEWKALGPKVMKVSSLSRRLSSYSGWGRTPPRPARTGDGGKRRPDRADRERGGDRGDRQPRDRGGRERTALQKSDSDLRKILANKEAKPEDITKSLTAYRKVRADAKAELALAKKELAKAVSGRYEAQLVLMGLLD